MSDRAPRVSAKDIIPILQRKGFCISRQSGSHKIYKNEAGKRVTVPFHGERILHPRILKSILRDGEISIEELQELL